MRERGGEVVGRDDPALAPNTIFYFVTAGRAGLTEDLQLADQNVAHFGSGLIMATLTL